MAKNNHASVLRRYVYNKETQAYNTYIQYAQYGTEAVSEYWSGRYSCYRGLHDELKTFKPNTIDDYDNEAFALGRVKTQLTDDPNPEESGPFDWGVEYAMMDTLHVLAQERIERFGE